jgi:hypothetical protein
MSTLAAIRPTDWNWILFFHLVTAFLLVGGMIVVLLVSLATRRARLEQLPLLRVIAFRTNLIVVIPMYVLVHVFGPMLANREYPHNEPNWIGTSFMLATLGTLLALILAALQFWALRRLRAGKTAGWQEWIADWLPALLLASLIAVIVLMSGKPS